MKIERRPHRLKSNARCEFPRNMIFFDVESYLKREGKITYHEPYLWVGYWYYQRKGKNNVLTRQWFHTDNPDEFWDWVSRKVYNNEALYMFAHNPSYDLVAGKGFPILKVKGYQLTRYYEKGRTFILTFKADRKSIHVLNVGNFYQGSVAQIGQAIGLEKMELDYDNPTIEQALPYCKRDVEIIAKAMLTWFDFCKDNDLGNFGKTAPKQAFNAFRHRFMPFPIFIHADVKANDIERDSYYGGRTEAFFIGKVPDKVVYTLDVNSMYPAVMRSNRYPYKLYAYRENLTPKGLAIVINDYQVTAKITVNVNLPCLPCRIKNRLIFPVGTFITTLPTPEIMLAMEFGRIERVHQAALYLSAPIFQEYVDFFYNERLKAKQAGNRVYDLLYKLMLNSLYGKFGEKSGDWQVEGPTNYEGAGYERVFSLTTGKWTTYKWIAGTMLVKEEEKEGYDSFPAIAGHVTGYARKLLWEYILKAGMDNVYYCDTDSLFVNKTGLDNLKSVIDTKELGFLKQEGTKKNLLIYGPKDYAFEGGEKHKGVPKTAERIGANRWKYTFWPKISTLIRNNSVDRYYNVEMEKELKRHYLKGWITETGKVVPFELTVINNDNYLIPWEETSYAKQGIKLMYPEQQDWVAKEYL